jgi:uncharacterized membrane protein
MQLLPSGSPEKWDLTSVNTLIKNGIDLASIIAGSLAVIYLIIGAYGYFTAFGNEEKATKAKNTILWALIGGLIIFLARIIINAIWTLASGGPPPAS